MVRRPPRSTRIDTPFPYTTLFRSDCRYLPPITFSALSGIRMTTQREPVHLIACLKGLISIVQAVGAPADPTRAPRGFDVSRRLLSEGEGFRRLSHPPHRQGGQISEVLRDRKIGGQGKRVDGGEGFGVRGI